MADVDKGLEPPSDRTRVRRLAERGRYDRATIDAILDEALVCHLGVVVDGEPHVIPTLHARIGDHLYVHGAVANHVLRALNAGGVVCATVTLLDGLVLARSAFHHSVNYRSVVVFGRAERVTDPDEQWAALSAFVEHVVPGRSNDTRPPTPTELRSTMVLRLPLDEASAKVRTGGPKEEPDDLGLDYWGGVVPLHLEAGEPEPDEHVTAGGAVPAYLHRYSR